MQCSKTDSYDCYQNTQAERINVIPKIEYLLNKPQNSGEAKKIVAESVAIYNSSRSHLALNYKTPDEIHRAF
ncbi:MAG: transposase [Alteromonadaceae bacterium]|nr:transposase [Alteromonadaceae bacterium]